LSTFLVVCAALADFITTADEAGDFYRMFSSMSDAQAISA